MEGMLILFVLFLVSGPILALMALAKSNRVARELQRVRLELGRLEFAGRQPAPTKESPQNVPTWDKVEEEETLSEPPPLPPLAPKEPTPKAQAPVPETPPTPPVVPTTRQPLPTPAQVVAEEPSQEREGIEWKAWLERLHLCPPDKETNGEVGLAAWWTTRIGTLLAVIAVVFLGVYVNHLTAPWVRFMELLGIACGVFALGWKLEKRMGRFGEIVSAGGLSMLYFTAYASHGVAAVQVTNQPWLGALFQIGALGLMLLWSDRKRDPNLSALGIGLGYVSCGFAASHGLAVMTLGGLVLLGTVGSFLLARRQWRLPFLVSAIGSYSGLLLFTWQQGHVLSLSSLFIATTTLLGTFSVALAKAAHGQEDQTWLRRGALAQASGASLVMLAGTLLLDPSQLSTAYALLFVAFTVHAVIAWRKVAFPMLFPAWTLKALTFLALFIVAEFEGPTRWLGLAAQSFALLWTMRSKERTPLWLEAGFWALWSTSFALFLNDSLAWHAEAFLINDPRRAIGWAYLAIALLIATLYHRPLGQRQSRTGRQQAFGFVMAFAIGIGSAQSFFIAPPDITPLIPLLGLMAVFLVIAHWQRSILPLIPSAFLIGLGHAQLWQSLELSLPWTMLAFLSTSLGGLAFVAAHLTKRHGSWGFLVAPVWVGLVTISGLILASRTPSPSGFFAYLTFFMVCSLAVTGSRSLLGDARPELRLGILILLGAVLAGYAMVVFEAVHVPWSLLITAGVLFALSRASHDRSFAMASVPSAILGALTYLLGPDGDPWSAGQDLTLGLGMIVSLFLGAWTLAKSHSEDARVFTKLIDALIHATALLVYFQGLSRHLDPALHGTLISLTTLGLCVVARRLPFPSLPWVSWLLPVLLLIFGGDHFDQPAAWLTSGLLLTAWRLSPEARFPAIWISALTLLWTMLNAGLGNIAPVALVTVAGLGYAIVYHSLKEEESADLSLFIGIVTIFLGLSAILAPQGQDIVWILLSSLGLAIQGWLLKHQVSRFRLWRDASRTWLFGAAALTMAQIAVATPAFGLRAMITPYWGLASIALFIGGLFGGLRAYRMIGLLGLITCIIRMFAVDIDDTFNRITAFAVVAVVLLGVGYLYTRFRNWIEQQDHTDQQQAESLD